MPASKRGGTKAAEQRRRDKVELEYATQLPVLWSRFPRIDADVVRTVWEQAEGMDEALAVLRRMHASATPSALPQAMPGSGGVADAPSGDAPHGSAVTWSCALCTLVNEPFARVCAACDSARGTPPLAATEVSVGAEREPIGVPAGAEDVSAGSRSARTGLDSSFLRALPHDALVSVLTLLSYDDTVRLGSTCRELRELAGVVPVRHVRLGARQRDWSDRRVLGLLRHIGELERVSVSSALAFHSFGALRSLPRAPCLIALSLSSPLLGDAHLEGWAAAFPALRELRLSGCALTPACLPSLLLFGRRPDADGGRRGAGSAQEGQGRGLTLLDLSANHALDTATMSALLCGLRQLSCLDMSRLPRLDGRLLNCPACPAVRDVSLKGFAASSAPLLSRWMHVEALSLQQCALVQLAVQLPRLRSLSVAGSRALVRLELRCGALSALDCASCARLETVAALGETRSVAVLNFATCRRLDGHAVAELIAQCAASLTRVNLNGLTRMRDETPPPWLRSASALREHVGRRLRFVDLRGSCAAGGAEAFFSAPADAVS